MKSCVTLTNRYISDRYLPDKAIDALDEAGARVHITNMHVPSRIIQLENKIEEVKANKTKAIGSQKFEEAANFRDIERKLQNELEEEKKEMGSRIAYKPRNSFRRKRGRGSCNDDRHPCQTDCTKRGQASN